MFGWFGPIFGPFGYAVHNRNILAAMVDQGADVLLVPSMFPEPPLSAVEEKLLPYCISYRDLPKDIIIVHCIPANALPTGKGYMIAYTTVESIEAHPNVCARLRLYDEVWVPSRFTSRSLVRGGLITKDITVVPEGVDPSFWRPTGARPTLGANEPMVLGYHGDWSTRKGVDELVFGACLAASERSPIRLVFWVNKGRARDESIRDQVLAEIVAFCPEKQLPAYVTVEVDVRVKTEKEIRGFYNNCHYYVHLGRGEAWNLTLCDAAAVGAPTIALAACGEKEFMVKKLFLKVRTEGTMLLSWFGSVGVGHHQEVPFWRIDVPDLVRVLRLARGAYETQVGKAARLSSYVREHVTWRIAAAHALARLAHVSSRVGLPGPYRDGH